MSLELKDAYKFISFGRTDDHFRSFRRWCWRRIETSRLKEAMCEVGAIVSEQQKQIVTRKTAIIYQEGCKFCFNGPQ